MFNRATKFLLCPGLSEQEKGKRENLDRAEEKPKPPRAAQEVVNSIPLKSVQCTIMQLNSIEQTLIVRLLKALWEMRRWTTHGSLHSRISFSFLLSRPYCWITSWSPSKVLFPFPALETRLFSRVSPSVMLSSESPQHPWKKLIPTNGFNHLLLLNIDFWCPSFSPAIKAVFLAIYWSSPQRSPIGTLKTT